MITKQTTSKSLLLLRVFSAIVFLIAMLLMMFYVSAINFGKEIYVNDDKGIQEVVVISPLGNKQTLQSSDGQYYFHGYLNSVIVSTDGTLQADQIQICNHDGYNVEITIAETEGDSYTFSTRGLSFFSKAEIFLHVNRIKLIFGFLFFCFYITFLIIPLKFISPIQKASAKLISELRKICFFVKTGKIRLLLSVVSALIIIFLLRFAAGIRFEVLYFSNTVLIHLIVFSFIIIPVTGIYFYKNIKPEKRFSFFSFWIIFYLLYFLVCPGDFAGNYGFHGFFFDYLFRPPQLGIFKSFFVPDTGYVALIPRITYGLASLADKYGASSIAITSLISLIIYSWIFALFCNPRFRFIIRNDYLRCFFVIFFAVFSLYSLSLSRHYSLSVTDVAYFGIILILIFLFKDLSELNWLKVITIIFIAGLFIFSKAHMIVIIPVSVLLLAYKIYRRELNYKNAAFLISILIFATIHLVIILSSMRQMVNIPAENMQSFTLTPKPPLLVGGFSFIYLLKSYSQFLYPGIGRLTGIAGYAVSLCGMLLMTGLFIYAVRIYKKDDKRVTALWFFAGNTIAFTSALLFFRTFPPDSQLVLSNSLLIKYLSNGGLFFSRYTIGIHTILTITVFPVLLSIVKDAFGCSHFGKKGIFVEIVYTSVFIAISAIWHYTPALNIEFWDTAKKEKWSEEWHYLSEKLSGESYYVPVLNYPARKQQIMSDDMIVLYDSDSAGYVRENINNDLFAVVIINNKHISSEYPDLKINVTGTGGDSVVVSPLYPVCDFYRFIVFYPDTVVEAGYINFLNDGAEVEYPEHYRIIGINKE